MALPAASQGSKSVQHEAIGSAVSPVSCSDSDVPACLASLVYLAMKVIQEQTAGVADLFHAVQIKAEEGLKGFYRGCTTNLLRTTPAAALTFTSFEMLSRKLKQMGAEQREKEQTQASQQGSTMSS